MLKMSNIGRIGILVEGNTSRLKVGILTINTYVRELFLKHCYVIVNS